MPDIYIPALLTGPGFPSAIGSAFASFTTFQDISPTPLPQSLGNTLRAGTKIELEAEGEFSTTGTPTLQLGFYYGAAATVLAASGAITTGSAAAAWPWHIKYRGIITAIGASGSINGSGYLDLGTSLTAQSSSPMPVTAAARVVTIDTTATKAWGVGAAWGTSSASNTLKTYNFTAFIYN